MVGDSLNVHPITYKFKWAFHSSDAFSGLLTRWTCKINPKGVQETVHLALQNGLLCERSGSHVTLRLSLLRGHRQVDSPLTDDGGHNNS